MYTIARLVSFGNDDKIMKENEIKTEEIDYGKSLCIWS